MYVLSLIWKSSVLFSGKNLPGFLGTISPPDVIVWLEGEVAE